MFQPLELGDLSVLEIRYKSLTVWVINHREKLPREGVESPSLEIYTGCLSGRCISAKPKFRLGTSGVPGQNSLACVTG